MGIGSNRLRQGIGVLACGVAFGGVAGPAAAHGQPAPEPSRPPARAPIRPEPAPGAQTPKVVSTTVVVPRTTSSTPAVTSTPSVSARTSVIRPAQTVRKQSPTPPHDDSLRATRRRATVAVGGVLGVAGRAARNVGRDPVLRHELPAALRRAGTRAAHDRGDHVPSARGARFEAVTSDGRAAGHSPGSAAALSLSR